MRGDPCCARAEPGMLPHDHDYGVNRDISDDEIDAFQSAGESDACTDFKVGDEERCDAGRGLESFDDGLRGIGSPSSARNRETLGRKAPKGAPRPSRRWCPGGTLKLQGALVFPSPALDRALPAHAATFCRSVGRDRSLAPRGPQAQGGISCVGRQRRQLITRGPWQPVARWFCLPSVPTRLVS